MMPLPRGRHGFSREYVAENQKQRIVGATAEVLDERGFDRVTVAAISARARVSKSDFYAHFASKDECFLVAYDEGVVRLREDVRSACAGRDDWGAGVCAGLGAALSGLAERPAEANLLLAEGLCAGPAVYTRFQRAVGGFVAYLRDESSPRAAAERLPEAADEAVVGGIASLVGRRVLAGEAGRLPDFFPDFAEFALTPYFGVAEARRIISSR